MKTTCIPVEKREVLLAEVAGMKVFYWYDYGVVMPDAVTSNGSVSTVAEWVSYYARKGYTVTSKISTDWNDPMAVTYALALAAGAARVNILNSYYADLERRIK